MRGGGALICRTHIPRLHSRFRCRWSGTNSRLRGFGWRHGRCTTRQRRHEGGRELMVYSLPPLPYAKDALEPHVSGLTLEVHYEKHHKGYLEKLKKLIDGKPEENESLEQLIRTTEGDVYDNA